MKLIALLLILLLTNSANAEGKCVGKFLNPITDICWTCMFPITVGSIPIMKSSKYKDTKNPKSPVCLCNRAGVPMPGVTIGFWEPVRVIEITRIPFCLMTLGGIQVAKGKNYGGFKKTKEEHKQGSKAFYHIHYYIHPAVALLNVLVDFGCIEQTSYDLAYISELDPAHTSDTLANFMSPETFLLSSPPAIAACAADCIAATAMKQSIETLFWCSGCQGSVYPLTGSTSQHIGGVATSRLLVTRELAKLHRVGLAKQTATSSSKPNGTLCKGSYTYRIPKNQYRTQMVYPVVTKSCQNIGMSDMLWGSGKEFPFKGEDFAYVIWRKRNCCLF